MLEIHATRMEIEAHLNQFKPIPPKYPLGEMCPRLEDCLRVLRNPYDTPYDANKFVGQAIVELPNGYTFRWVEKLDTPAG